MLYFNSTNAATAVVKQEVMRAGSCVVRCLEVLPGSEAAEVFHLQKTLKVTSTVTPAGWRNLLGDRRDHGSDHISSRDFNS